MHRGSLCVCCCEPLDVSSHGAWLAKTCAGKDEVEAEQTMGLVEWDKGSLLVQLHLAREGSLLLILKMAPYFKQTNKHRELVSVTAVVNFAPLP